MRVIALILLLASALPARAAEVLWLDPASEQDIARVADAAGAAGPPLAPIDLRAAATAWGPGDDAALSALQEALRDLRMYETRLDGELLIMRGLERPLQQVTALRGPDDRDILFAALAYQGFAVDRFFADDLPTDERAEPYRARVGGVVVERPWMDAVAIAPDRDVTAYEIAEAPQRVAFGSVKQIVRGALPAEIHVEGLSEGTTLLIDGVPRQPGSTGGYRVLPGRHLVAVEVDDHLVARWDLRLEPADAVDLALPLTTAAWERFLADLRAGGTPEVPDALAPSIEALGGEVWIAHAPASGKVRAVRLTTEGVQPVDLAPARPHEPEQPGGPGGGSLAVALTGGWLYSADFYLQDPIGAPHEAATVNSPAAGLSLDVAWDLGLLRLAGGVHAAYTPGDHHLALYGGDVTRIRPHPWLGVGIRYAQATAGWLFPHHPAVGARATVPILAGLEAQAHGLYGPGLERTRGDGSVYEGGPLWGVHLGIGWRFAP